MAGLRARSRTRHRRVVAALLTASLMLLVSALPSEIAPGGLGRSLGPDKGWVGESASHSSGRALSAISPGSIHTLTVTASNVTTLQGDSVNFTVHAPSGVTPVSYNWVFGDGTNESSASATVSYTYANAGQYLIYVQAMTASGTVYDNLAALLPFSVQSSYAADTEGNLALLNGAIQENSTSNRSAQADIAPGGSVLAANWIDAGPNSPFWRENPPFYTLSPGAQPFTILSPPVLTLSGVDAEAASFANATPFGSYQLSFEESTSTSQGTGSNATSSFIFTVFVAIGAAVATAALPTSPHAGTLNVYMTGANAQLDADPATTYPAPGFTADYNVYQTLVAYNGSQSGPDPTDFVPDLATCVPGPECQSLYGTSLIASNGDWTFVLNPNATFYNVTTGAHYPVTPNDVAFSFVRACLLTDVPGYGVHGSWTFCQALLPTSTANASWDDGIHSPLNNTPANLLAAISVNDSSYCTPKMMNGVNGAGCVTLHTGLSGQVWPELLELVAEPWGGSVTSCRWITAEGYGLPGWGSGNSCAPPSSVPSATAWDSQEIREGLWVNSTGHINTSSPFVYHAVGSGPYALASVSPNGGQFQLIANPYWGGTTCSGGLREGCLPPAPVGGIPAYIGTVNVYVNGTVANQTAAVLNGTADIAGFETPFAPSFVVNEFRQGKLQLLDLPTILGYVAGMTMIVNLTLAQTLTTTPLSFPSNLMTDLNFRQFLIHSFPTPTFQSACLTDGIESCFQTGGAIPAYMSPYYPSNISWFFGTPDPNPSDVGSAGWWWSQTASDGLDGKNCTTASPCTFPIVQGTGGLSASVLQTWVTDVRAISQGAIAPVIVAYTGPSLTTLEYEGATPLYSGGWAPDYVDPSEYVGAYYLTTGPWGGISSFATLMENASFDHSCSGPAVDPTVTVSCEGTAYREMENLSIQAGDCALPSCNETQRVLLYNMVERIANGLGLYVNTGQVTTVFTAAPWIDTTTISRNLMVLSPVYGGPPFYYIADRGSVPYGYPLVVSPVADPSPSHAGAADATQFALVRRPDASPALTIEAGETVVFSATAAGGSGVYHFDWVGLPPGCASSNSPFVVCSPNGSATTTVSVVVTDSTGITSPAAGLGVSVVAHLKVQGLVLSPSSVTVGHTVTVQVMESGGLSPLTFSYLGLPSGCSSANTSTLVCTPSMAGTYAIVAQVVDRVGITALGSAGLIVTSSTSSPGFWAIGWTAAEILAASTGVAGFLIGAAVAFYIDRRRRPPPEESSAPAPPSSGPPG